MEFNEAYNKAKDGDKVVCGAFEIIKGERDRLIGLSVVLSDWQIIPAKKEPVTVNEAWNSKIWSKKEDLLYRGTFNDIWKASAENTHLLYADLMGNIESEREDLENDGFGKISEEFHKIRASLESTSTD